MTPQVMAFIATIGVLGYLCDSIVRALARLAHALVCGRARNRSTERGDAALR